MKSYKNLVSIVALLLFGQFSLAEVDLLKKHVFYLHGAIIEKGDLKPIHPQYGLYDYPAIINALSSHGFHFISEQRGINTDHVSYAKKVSAQINDLISKGVKPEGITVIGFSKGAMITAITSSLLKNKDLNFVIMATCGDWYESEGLLSELRLYGNILSVYEESDLAGSCQNLANRSPAPSSFTEIAINTGKQHGAFYLPRDEWIKPVVFWIKEK